MSLLETLCHDAASVSSSRKSFVKKFGAKLRFLREERDLTLKDAAVALGYKTHSHLSAIESGIKAPTVEMVVKVARLFDVTTDALVDDGIAINALRGKPEKGSV